MTSLHYARLLLDHLSGRQEKMVQLLDALVSADSPSDDAEAQAAVAAILRDRFADAGMRVRTVPGSSSGEHLLAVPHSRDRGGPLQLIVGHLDTVWPVGTAQQRPLHQVDSRLEGPGAYDMKGGLVQAIFALDALKQLRLVPEVQPIFFINSDEETGSKGSRVWLECLAHVVKRAFIMEPSFGTYGALKLQRKGVGRFEVKIAGRAAHAGVAPEAGVSAILELSIQVQRLFALNDGDQGITVNVGMIDGGLRPNVIAPHASAMVDVRVPTIADGERIEAAIRGLQPSQPGISITVEGSISRPPMEINPRNQALWEQAAEAGKALGLELEAVSVGGASDGNFTSLYTPTLDGLGAVGDGAHAVHEYVDKSRLAERAALLALLLLLPAGGTKA